MAWKNFKCCRNN